MSEAQGVKAGENMALVDDVAAVGARVRELRKAQGLTQRGLAETVGLQQRTLARLEAGDVQGFITERTLTKLIDIAGLLGIEMKYRIVPYAEFIAYMGEARSKAVERRAKREARRLARAQREKAKIKAAVEETKGPMADYKPAEAHAKLEAERVKLVTEERTPPDFEKFAQGMLQVRDAFEAAERDNKRRAVFENMALLIDLHKEGALAPDAVLSALSALIVKGAKS